MVRRASWPAHEKDTHASASSGPCPDDMIRSEPSREKKRISQDEWFAKLHAEKVDGREMNMLIMDYLVKQGYAEAAAAFQEETLTEPVSLDYAQKSVTKVDLETIRGRDAVRQAVHEGDVLEALELARKLDSVTMEERPELTFRLKLEHLVRLILVDKVEESIAFSQEHLAPIAETDPKALEALENAMTLLAFPDAEAARASPMGKALGLEDDEERLHTIANELNAALLAKESGMGPGDSNPSVTQPALHLAFKDMLYRERKLRERGVDFPGVSREDLLGSSRLVYEDGTTGEEEKETSERSASPTPGEPYSEPPQPRSMTI